MKKYIIALVALVLVISVVTLLNNKSEGDTIKIGGAFVLTGPLTPIGVLQQNGATLAVNEINKAGGINGKKVELIIEDSAYDSKQSVNAYQALKLKGARYIIADGSPVVSSIRKLVVDDGNLIIAPGATTPVYFDNNNLSCRLALTARNFGPAFSELLSKKGYTRVATLFPDNEYGRGVSAEFTKAYEASGGKIIVSEFYNAAPGTGDYRTNLTKIKAQQSQVDAVLFVQVANTVEAMLKQFKEIGVTKPMVSDYYTIFNPALKDLSLANSIAFVDYQYVSTPRTSDSAVAAKFKTEYRNIYGNDPVFLAAGNYDAARLIMEAIGKVGDNPKKVAEYISGLKNYQAITGEMSFNSDCEVDRQTVFREVKEGNIVDMSI